MHRSLLCFVLTIFIFSNCSKADNKKQDTQSTIRKDDIVFDNGNIKRPEIDYNKIRGLGLPAYLNKRKRFDSILSNAIETDFNTIVLFFKDVDPRGDYYKKIETGKTIITNNGKLITKKIYENKLIERHLGNVYFPSKVPLVKTIGAQRSLITNVSAIQKKLWQQNLELAARFCLFGDRKMADYLHAQKIAKINSITISNTNQSRWASPHIITNNGKIIVKPVTVQNKSIPGNRPEFVDPLNKTVLEYNVALIKELYDLGIRIFIFDYVRMDDPAGSAKYNPANNVFNHIVIEQAVIYIKNELDQYRQKNPWGPEPFYAISVYGRVLFRRFDGTMDPIGQNIKTFSQLGYYISSMDYTHLLLKEYRKTPYEGRKLYLKYGMEKIDRKYFIPWVDSTVLSAPKDEKKDYVYKELLAVIDSDIEKYLFWIPSGSSKEFTRVFAAMKKLQQTQRNK